MGLDTRGFMDGALRAYDVADRYYQRKEDRKLQKEQLEQDREAREQRMSLRQAQEQRRQKQFEYNYGKDGQGGALRDKQERDEKLFDARLKSQQTQQELNEYQLNRTKRINFVQDNKPVLDNAFSKFLEDPTKVDPVLDNEMIKGTAEDPRRYLDPDVVDSFEYLNRQGPEIINGNVPLDNPELKKSIYNVYKNNFDAVIGQKDPKTGKVIKAVRAGAPVLAADINPELEGGQPGIIFTAEVNYGDDEWASKPITEGRSTTDEHVKVIPLEQFMQDLTGQMSRYAKVKASSAYKSIYGEKDDGTTKAYRKDLVSIGKAEAKALADLEKEAAGPAAGDPEQIDRARAQIRSTYDQQRARLTQVYGMEQEGQAGDGGGNPQTPPAIQQWANSDPNKGQFLQALQQKGYKLEGYDPETLENAYQAQLRKAREAKRKAASAATAAELRKANGNGGGVRSAQGAAALYQANVNR